MEELKQEILREVRKEFSPEIQRQSDEINLLIGRVRFLRGLLGVPNHTEMDPDHPDHLLSSLGDPVNCTPHDIIVEWNDAEGKPHSKTYPRSGIRLTVEELKRVHVANLLCGVPVAEAPEFSRIVAGYKEFKKAYGTGCPVIVSAITAPILAPKHRGYVFTPDTGSGGIRDEHGAIKGTTRLHLYRP